MSRRAIATALLTAALALAPARPAAAQAAAPGAAPAADPGLAFAAHLADLEPAMAVLELRRLAWLRRGTRAAIAPRLALAGFALAAGDAAAAAAGLHRARREAAGDPVKVDRVDLALARLAEARGRTEEAAGRYLALATPTGPTRAAACWLRARRWAEAEQAARAAGLPALAVAVAEHARRPRLSPAQASARSAWLPGSGQVAAGAWPEALGSLGVNAGWVAAAGWLAFGRQDVAGTLFVLNYGPRYWLGGIQRAGDLAEARLARDDAAFLAVLEAADPDLFAPPPPIPTFHAGEQPI